MGGALTVTRRTTSELRFRLSTTCRRTKWMPPDAKTWPTAAPVASIVPSLSKSHWVSAIDAPGAADEVEVNVADEPATGGTGATVKSAVGGGGGSTVTWRTTSELRFLLSTTCRRTKWVPPYAKTWPATAPVASIVPSLSKSHCVSAIEAPSPADDVEVNVAVEPATGGTGATVKSAVGGGGATAVTDLTIVSVSCASSVTRRVTLCGPAAKVCVTVRPVASNVPSLSKSHSVETICCPAVVEEMDVSVATSPATTVPGATVKSAVGAAAAGAAAPSARQRLTPIEA